ncbi:MAG: agmatinase [Candidatus Woesearchaeota archaeon]
MEYQKYPKNFLELEDKFSNYEISKVAILPVPYEKTTTYIKGTARGPAAILEASLAVEFYDEELDKTACDVGICTLNELNILEEPELMVDIVYENVKKILDDKKFLIVVGGEHSITSGCVKAFSEEYDKLSVLQIDAHADLREENEGSRFNHGCAMRRCYDICKNIVQVGIRSLSYEEAEFIKEKNLNIFWAKDIAENENWFDDAVSKLTENVYITLDLDGFDPSIIPSTGTPEPGGLLYYPMLRFLRKVFKEKNVVGFDVVELCPNEKEISSDFIAAKVIYKMIGYKFDKEV